MLTLSELRKSVGGRILFETPSLTVNYGERVALIGPNGAGKSTLFNMILGRDDVDAGTIQRDAWTMVGFLPQEAEAVGDETVLDIALGRSVEVPALEKRLRELEKAGTVDGPEYLEAHAKHEALSDAHVEAKAKKMLKGLGYKEADFQRPGREMSGGWIMRAHLARLLVMEPDLLMLDEPTNHLDLLSLLWLQQYLKNYSGAVLLISHDRQFMDEIVETIYEISECRLHSYTGNYTAYLRQKEERYEQQNAAYKNQQKEIASLRAFYDRVPLGCQQGVAGDEQAQADRAHGVDRETARAAQAVPVPDSAAARSGQRVVSLEAVHMAYGAVKVYEGLDLTIERSERIVLVGPNGSGKSTLLKMLAGVLEFQKGARNLGHQTKIGYFSQHRSATLDPEKSVLQEVMDAGAELREEDARGILGSFLFRKDDIYKKTAILSGGEKTRLNLIKFLVDPPNLLLMDEPTTHLDIHTVESLVLALERFEGTLVFISHDVHFIRQLASKVLHVNNGQVTSYPGGYDYFLEKTGSLNDERTALTAG